jgi:hypothetical protein
MRKETTFSDRKQTGLIVILIAAMFALSCGLGYGIPSVIYPLKKAHAAKKWSKQECKIIRNEVKRHGTVGSQNSNHAYAINVQYSYTFDDVDYMSDQYDFQSAFFRQFYDTPEEAKTFTEIFDPNSSQVCYVNPEKPSEAVLSFKIHGFFKKAITSSCFMLVGLGLIFVCILQKRKNVRFEEGLLSGQGLPKTYSSSKVRLFYFSGYLLAFLGLLVVTLLVGNKQSGYANYLLAKIFFGGIALGSLIFVIKSLIKIFILPVKITLNPARLRIGENLEVTWKVGMQSEKITQLCIGILCTGTVRDVETNEYFDKILHSKREFISDGDIIRSGCKTYAIPNTTEIIDALESTSCRWVFNFQAQVKGLPDIDDEYEFEVHGEGN